MIDLVPMTEAHIDELMAYERELFGDDSWTAGGYRAELADKRSRHYLVARDDDTLVGWGGVLVAADEAEVLTVGVAPAARRRGIAMRLLHALYAEAVRRGARKMFLEVRPDNVAALSLYEREGFVEIGRRPGYYDHGRTEAVMMRRELTP